MHEASPAASFIHVRSSRLRFNRAACSSARPLRIRGADRFVLSGSPVVPALVSATHVVSRRSLERWPDCVCGQCQFRCAWRSLRFGQHAVHSCRNRSGHCWRFWKEPETVAFGYLRERLYWEQRVVRHDLWLSATCAVLLPASDGLSFSKARRTLSFLDFWSRLRCSIPKEEPAQRLVAGAVEATSDAAENIGPQRFGNHFWECPVSSWGDKRGSSSWGPNISLRLR